MNNERPENPCRVVAIDPKTDLMKQIIDALWASGPPKCKCIWLPDEPEYHLKSEHIDDIPVKYTRWNRGGSQGIWLEELSGDE